MMSRTNTATRRIAALHTALCSSGLVRNGRLLIFGFVEHRLDLARVLLADLGDHLSERAARFSEREALLLKIDADEAHPLGLRDARPCVELALSALIEIGSISFSAEPRKGEEGVSGCSCETNVHLVSELCDSA